MRLRAPRQVILGIKKRPISKPFKYNTHILSASTFFFYRWCTFTNTPKFPQHIEQYSFFAAIFCNCFSDFLIAFLFLFFIFVFYFNFCIFKKQLLKRGPALFSAPPLILLIFSLFYDTFLLISLHSIFTLYFYIFFSSFFTSCL